MQKWRFAICSPKNDFEIKHDLCHKARLVIGGHITDASLYDCYSSTIRTENIYLLFYLSMINNHSILGGDIGNAYLNAYTDEKICSIAGPKFGNRKGMKVIIRKALYGLKSSGNAWYHTLASKLREMGFQVSHINHCIWYRENEDGTYDYIAHHVDDFLVVGLDPTTIAKELEEYWDLHHVEVSEFYLGMNTDVTISKDG